MIRTVTAGQSLQSAIDAAQLGDTINVEAGATFRGPIELPAKTGSGEIVIQSSRVSELPAGRVSAAHALLMPKIMGQNADSSNAIRTKLGAAFYKLVGLEVVADPAAASVYDLVKLGDGRDVQKTIDSVPHHLTLDRMLIHGLPDRDVQRGVCLNSGETTISNCYIYDIHMVGIEAQAIAGWNGPGPFHIINNYLEGSTQNILFGGADPASEALIPSNIEIRGNHLFKPLSWKVGHPTFVPIMRMENGVLTVKHWTIKNILEFKIGKNIVVDGNVLENNWVDGQSGIAVLFTVRNQEGSAPYAVILNATYSNNTLRNSEGGAINLLGSDNEKPSQRCSGLVIKNSLFTDIKGSFLTINGYNDVTLDHNTHLQAGNLTTFYGDQSNGFKYTNNLTVDHEYGIAGDDGPSGRPALDRYAPGWTWAGNVTAKPYDQGSYPTGNDYPASLTLPADYRSPIAGKGCDVDALKAAQAGTVTIPTPVPAPMPTPAPTPTPTPVPAAPDIPTGSRVEVVSRANVRETPSASSTIKSIAEVGEFGTTTGAAQLDSASRNTYVPVDFVVGVDGFVAIQFLKVAAETPTPAPTPPPAPSIRTVSYPKQPSKRNTILAAQWKERYRLKSEGDTSAVFEKVI